MRNKILIFSSHQQIQTIKNKFETMKIYYVFFPFWIAYLTHRIVVCYEAEHELFLSGLSAAEDVQLPPGAESFSPVILSFPLRFFNTTYYRAFVNVKGAISFGSGKSTFLFEQMHAGKKGNHSTF